MKTLFILVSLAVFCVCVFGDDDPKAQPARAPENDEGNKPPQPAPQGCTMKLGNPVPSNDKPLPAGCQVCWRHPEYLTCTASGDWIPKFCEKGTICVETGCKVQCVAHTPVNANVNEVAPQPQAAQNTPVDNQVKAAEPANAEVHRA